MPGNPILGDGKSDNQNHVIVFYRGEYLQLIDANRDNYLEECLKIRNILGEFEEYNMSCLCFLSSVLRSKVDIDIIQIVRLRGP